MKTYLVDRNRWQNLSIFDQMGNIYSEVGRSLNAKATGDSKTCQQAMTRALDLFDATTDALVKQKSVRSKEVLRAKDQFLRAVYEDTGSKDRTSLDKYFYYFAVAARINS